MKKPVKAQSKTSHPGFVSQLTPRQLSARIDIMQATNTLLHAIGENPAREGLVDTPARVAKAWEELTIGYQQNPRDILAKDFNGDGYDQVVACPFIEFTSMCEHHLLPFMGVAHLAYVPGNRVVGLSKLGRLVDCFARRLQIQEQMTNQIADAMQTHLAPRGVAVVVQARHLCMACRGVQKRSSVMVTSAMHGVFRTQASARAEFFKLVELAHLTPGR